MVCVVLKTSTQHITANELCFYKLKIYTYFSFTFQFGIVFRLYLPVLDLVSIFVFSMLTFYAKFWCGFQMSIFCFALCECKLPEVEAIDIIVIKLWFKSKDLMILISPWSHFITFLLFWLILIDLSCIQWRFQELLERGMQWICTLKKADKQKSHQLFSTLAWPSKSWKTLTSKKGHHQCQGPVNPKKDETTNKQAKNGRWGDAFPVIPNVELQSKYVNITPHTTLILDHNYQGPGQGPPICKDEDKDKAEPQGRGQGQLLQIGP